MRDDKAAQHEEEINEQPRAANKARVVKVPISAEMKNRDQQRADAAQAVQHPEMFGLRFFLHAGYRKVGEIGQAAIKVIPAPVDSCKRGVCLRRRACYLTL